MRIFVTILFFVMVKVYSQDIIIKKDSTILNVDIFYFGNDTVKYVNDSTKNESFVLRKSLLAVKFKNNSEYKENYHSNPFSEVYNKITRYNKKGFYYGFDIYGGTSAFDWYNQGIEIPDTCYVNGGNNYSFFSRGDFIGRYNTSNFMGIKIGIGYQYHIYETKADIYEGSGYDFYEKPIIEKYKRKVVVNSLVLPFGIYLVPGNIYGFFAEVGGSVYLPFSAKYSQTYEDLKNNKTEITEGSFISEARKSFLYFEGIVGMHLIEKEQYLSYIGLYMAMGFPKNANLLLGLKLGITIKK